MATVFINAGDTAISSTTWKLENCQLKADLCTLDTALDNNYTDHLLEGKSLNIVYNTFSSHIHTILSMDSQANISRSLTRLRTIFLSLDRDFAGARAARFKNKKWNNV